MKLVILVNGLDTELETFTTTHLALAAVKRGHEVWYAEVEGFLYEPTGRLSARCYRAPENNRTVARFFQALSSVEAETVELNAGDVLFLRNNPADDAVNRPWAQTVGLTFGCVAKRLGLLVLNDPDGLMQAMSKIYVQSLPERVRPETLIARDVDALRAFVKERGAAVIKPIGGSGGQGVFVVKNASDPNFNVIVEAVLEYGYAVAQEYLPAAAGGDIRLFMLNGRPFEVDGKYAAIHRFSVNGDARSNMSAGGKAKRAIITDEVLEIAELVRPKLVEDGLFLVGLDIAGGRVLEVNVFSPGGLMTAAAFGKVDFCAAIIAAIEDKLTAVERYDQRFDNRVIATL
jgi:glutathione synthase